MIPAGRYSAVVVPVSTDFGPLVCQFGHSKQKGTPQVVVTFEIISGPCSGDRISWVGFFTDKTTDRTLESLRICGFTGDDLDKFNDQRPENEVHLLIENETGQDGKTYPKVRWVNDPQRSGGFVIDQMDPKALRTFASQLKGKLKSFPVVTGRKAERKPRGPEPQAAPDDTWRGNDEPDPPPPQDDDIPF